MASGVVPAYPCTVAYNGITRTLAVGTAAEMVREAIDLFAMRTTDPNGWESVEYPDSHFNLVLFHKDGTVLAADEKPLAGELLYMRPRTVGGGSVGYENRTSAAPKLTREERDARRAVKLKDLADTPDARSEGHE